MFKQGHIIALVTLFVVAKSEDCKPPTPDFISNAAACCMSVPSEFDEVLTTCEGKGDLTPCEVLDCTFEKLNFVKDGKLDYTAIAVFMDEETKKTPEYKVAMSKIKDTCYRDLSGDAPGIPCESMRIIFCMDQIIFRDCPDKLWTKSDECDAAKDFMKRCPAAFNFA